MEEYNRLKQFTFNGMLAEDTLFEMQKNGVCVKEGIVQKPVTRICETDFSPILWQQATEMSSVYVLIFCIENTLRNFVVDRLSEKFGICNTDVLAHSVYYKVVANKNVNQILLYTHSTNLEKFLIDLEGQKDCFDNQK